MYNDITPESLKAAMMAKFAEAGWDTSEGSAADLLVGPMATELWKRYMQDLAIPAMLFVDDGSGAYIDKAAGIYGLVRKDGTKATTVMTFTGTAGTVIPAGTAFLTGDEMEFRLTGAVTLDGTGHGSGTATAAQVGGAYNIGANELIRMFIALPGLTSWTNGAAVGGSDNESDAALVDRYYKRLRTPGTSSNVHDYELWALSVDGVGYVRVQPLWDGPGTVRVVLASGEGRAVGAEIVANVVAVIEDPVTGRAVGAEVTVISATELPIAVSATLTLDAGAELETVRQAIVSNLDTYMDGTIFATDKVLYNRVLALILLVPGVIDATGLTLNGGTGNITVTPLQIPVLGTVVMAEAV